MNRRSFIQRCFAGLGGAVVAFMPGKKKPDCPTGNKCDSNCSLYSQCQEGYEEWQQEVNKVLCKEQMKYKWRRWAKLDKEPQSAVKPLEGKDACNWVVSYKARILNDDFATVINGGTPEEMEKLYDRLIKEFPDKA